MKTVGLAALTAVICISASQAEARRGGGVGHRETLEFHSETTMSDGAGDVLSLCVLADTTTVVGFVNLWRSQSFVLAADRCSGESYYDYSTIQLGLDRARGLIDRDTPDTPALTMTQMTEGFWGLGALVALLGYAGVSKLRGGGGGGGTTGRRRGNLIGPDDGIVKRIIVVMAGAAHADGTLGADELAVIHDTVNNIAPQPLEPQDILAIVSAMPKSLSKADFAALGHGLDLEDRQDLLKAAVMVTSSDGHMAKKEAAYLDQLSAGLELTSEQVQEIIGEMGLNA